MKVTLCIPVLNPGALAKRMVSALKQQTLQPDVILVIDSDSTDGSIDSYSSLGAKIIPIKRSEFDHGGTRNLSFEESRADIYIFMTQDAIPVDSDALKNIVQILFDNPKCGLVYGRQVPAEGAGVFARHARLYNYPPGDRVELRGMGDVARLGIKAAFCSNSFAAYRRESMEQIGFFPQGTLFAEDSIAAAKLLSHGWQIGYAPQAMVEHSHDYSLKQDFCRYFDVGAFHSMNVWYRKLLGRAEGEGLRFVRSEWAFLRREGVHFAGVRVILKNGGRWLGYRLGRLHQWLPMGMKIRMTTNRAFWKRSGRGGRGNELR